MSVSGIMDQSRNVIVDTLIPPRDLKNGELITGNKYDWSKSILPRKIAVPVGEDGSFLQADSTTETGLRWVKLNLPDESYKQKMEDEIMQLKTQFGKLNDDCVNLQLDKIKKSMSNINMNMHGHGGKRRSKRNRRTHKKQKQRG
jgi:hypothetical protein